MTTTLPDRGPDTGPIIEAALDDRGARAAFVASLAVGLASAGWEASNAGPELLAAAGDEARILDAANARLLDRWVIDPPMVVRAGHLLEEARRLCGPAEDAAPLTAPAKPRPMPRTVR